MMKNRHRYLLPIILFTLSLSLSACKSSMDTDAGSSVETQTEKTDHDERKKEDPDTKTEEMTQEEDRMKLLIGETEVEVAWEDNESVEALKELVKSAPLTIEMSMYGGFEQVGAIGSSLPRNDVQTTTQSGDIVLYSGNQIVIFYGSNSWAYTRLGRVTDQSAEDMKELLGNGDVTLTLRVD